MGPYILEFKSRRAPKIRMNDRYVLERAYPYAEKIKWAEDEFNDVVKRQLNDEFRPAELKNEDEIEGGYRTVCHFQLEVIEDCMHYMKRDFFKLVPIKDDIFPPAEVHIQTAMAIVLEIMNAMDSEDPLRRHLGAIRFLTDANGQEMHIHLYYTAIDCNEREWKESSGFLLTALMHNSGEGNAVSLTGCYNKIKYYNALYCSYDNDCNNFEDYVKIEYGIGPDMDKCTDQIEVSFKKPMDAFQHPNVICMHQALAWLVTQMNSLAIQRNETVSLLELYGGYGAHTMLLGAARKTVKKITMIELDARLSKAALVNIELNNLEDRVDIITGDAANQTAKLLKSSHFDTLLVDPPRQGLTTLIPVLQKGEHAIQDIFYVSCCLTSLRIDLEALCVQSKMYRVKDWCTTDLVPQSDDLECLIHLERVHEVPDEQNSPFIPYRNRKNWSCCPRNGRFVPLPWYLHSCLSCGKGELHPRFTDEGRDLVKKHKVLSKEIVGLIKSSSSIRDLWKEYSEDLYDKKTILWKMAGPKLYSIQLLESFLMRVDERR